jgi:hypothetical protein
MKHVAVILALVALAGCGGGSNDRQGPFMIDGKISLQNSTLDLVNIDSRFIDTTTPVSTGASLYLEDGSVCLFNVFLQSGSVVNESIITFDTPLHQKPSCELLEKSFLLKMIDHFVGTLTEI